MQPVLQAAFDILTRTESTRSTFSTALYYKLLADYLKQKHSWTLTKIDRDEYGIYDKTSKLIGKITRVFKASEKTLVLQQLATAVVDGDRLSGIGLTEKIYEFESKLPKSYDIDFFKVSPVNSIIRAKIEKFYGKLPQVKRGTYTTISVGS
jgi:hypothetical protein